MTVTSEMAGADYAPGDPARAFLARGWDPLPLYGLRPDGACSCRHGSACKSPGKHPVSNGWQKAERMTKADTFAHWDTETQARNVGIRTGRLSSLWALDIDPKSGGDKALAALIAQHGPLPQTRTHRTGSGGLHYLFKLPADFEVTNSRGSLPPGIDVRGNGGFIVMPPSVSGVGPYSVADPADVVPAPNWLLDYIRPADHQEVVLEDADGVAYGDLSPDQQATSDRYLQAARQGEIDRLKAMRDAATADLYEYRGEPWNPTTFEIACNLLELAQSPWAKYGLEDVRRDLAENAPTDAGFTLTDVMGCLRSAANKVRGNARPAPGGIKPVMSFEEMTAGVRHVGQTAAQATEYRVVDPSAEDYTFSTGGALQADIAHKFATYELGVSTLFVGGLGWHRWDGKRFAPIPDDALLRTLSSWASKQLRPMQETFNQKAKEQPGFAETAEGKALKALIAGYSSILNNTGVAKGAIEWARARVRHEADEFDADPHLLNVQNGIVDLRTGALEPHNPLRMMTKIAAVDYVPGATHPDWSAALQAIPGDEVREYLQVVFGQAATGSKPDDDRARILEGGGANGKSTIVTPFMKALGSYATVASDKILLAAGNEHTTDLTDLKGVRLALLEELPETGGAHPSINIARLKKMLGTERMKARRMRQDNIEWRVSHSLLITTNYMVSVTDTDHGTWRRLCRVVFPFRFTSNPVAESDIKADPGLRDRLSDGRSGQHEAVLAWAVEGAKRWYANGDGTHGRMPEMPKRVQDDTDAWREKQDVIFEFLNAGIVEFKPGSFVQSSELHAAFEAFNPSAGLPINAFVHRFAAHGLVQDNRVASSRRKTSSLNLSRPHLDNNAPVPAQTTAWSGLAFTEAYRDRDTFFGEMP